MLDVPNVILEGLPFIQTPHFPQRTGILLQLNAFLCFALLSLLVLFSGSIGVEWVEENSFKLAYRWMFNVSCDLLAGFELLLCSRFSV